MNQIGRVEIILAVIVLGWVILRQLRPRPLKRWPVVGIFLTGLGVLAAIAVLSKHAFSSSAAGALSLSLSIGAALAIARAFTVRLWPDPAGAAVIRQGNGLTALLWLLGAALHVGIDHIDRSGVGSATIQFYFGLMLIVQSVVLNARARPLRRVLSPGSERLVAPGSHPGMENE